MPVAKDVELPIRIPAEDDLAFLSGRQKRDALLLKPVLQRLSGKAPSVPEAAARDDKRGVYGIYEGREEILVRAVMRRDEHVGLHCEPLLQNMRKRIPPRIARYQHKTVPVAGEAQHEGCVIAFPLLRAVRPLRQRLWRSVRRRWVEYFKTQSAVFDARGKAFPCGGNARSMAGERGGPWLFQRAFGFMPVVP